MDKHKDRMIRRKRKARSVRKRLLRRSERLRLAVFRSNRYIYAQIVDDHRGVTLASASSREAELGKPADGTKGKAGIAAHVGSVIAERAKQAGIDRVVFDRRHYKFHGRIKALADAARKSGLSF